MSTPAFVLALGLVLLLAAYLLVVGQLGCR